MVTINNDVLRETYNYLATIDNILRKEVKHIIGNKNYIDKIVPFHLSRIYSNKEKTALNFADNLTKIAYENSVVSIVATFERVIFAKYRTTYGSIKKLVSTNAAKPLDYFKSKENFINDKIDKLSGIIYLIESYLPPQLLQQLKVIKDHRNYIAHGKRDVAPPSVEMELNIMAKLLDDIIREIEN